MHTSNVIRPSTSPGSARQPLALLCAAAAGTLTGAPRFVPDLDELLLATLATDSDIRCHRSRSLRNGANGTTVSQFRAGYRFALKWRLGPADFVLRPQVLEDCRCRVPDSGVRVP